MAANDATLDQVFQEWDDQRIKLRTHEGAADKLGPWSTLVNQRMKLFVERWRPDRMKVLKRLGNQASTTADSVRGNLTPLARDEFLSDLKSWGVPDRYANQALSLIEVK